MGTLMQVRNLLVTITHNWNKEFFLMNVEKALKNLKKVY